jgi:hypothetical protein
MPEECEPMAVLGCKQQPIYSFICTRLDRKGSRPCSLRQALAKWKWWIG